MKTVRVEFWATAPVGKVSREEEYDSSFYRDEEAFAEKLDEYLMEWLQVWNLGEWVIEHGWKRI